MKKMFEQLESRRLMTTFTVTSFADSGPGTLRDAITQANITPDADVINFKIGAGGAANIGLKSSLMVVRPVTIDATTQPGYNGTPLVRLYDANNVPFGLSLNAAGSVVRGFSITGFGNPAVANDGTGIYVNAAATIEKCYVGLRPDGTSAGNEGEGISISGANTYIRDNVISANGKDGVLVFADYCAFTGNIIGLNPTGTAARPNLDHGIFVLSGYDAQIGFNGQLDVPNPGNTIAGNGKAGVYLKSSGHRILSNNFGTSKSGNAMIANGTYGIYADGSSRNLIGSKDVGNRFGGDGIYVRGNAGMNLIRHNTFGIGATPIFDIGRNIGINLDTASGTEISDNVVGNLTTGIRVGGFANSVIANRVGRTANGLAAPNQLGVTVNGDRNLIKFNSITNNSLYGVWVIAGERNVIRSSIWNNGQSVWVSPGANAGLPKATLVSVTANDDGSYEAFATFNSPSAITYRIAFYVSDGPGHPVSGDMQEMIYTVDVKLRKDYDWHVFQFTPTQLVDGRYLTMVMQGINTLDYTDGNTAQPTPSLKVVGPPVVYSSSFVNNGLPTWNFTFSADVSKTLNASDLSIRNTTTNQLYQPTSVTWDASTNSARFVRSVALPAGKYVASIKSGSISNTWGANVGNFPLSFTVLAPVPVTATANLMASSQSTGKVIDLLTPQPSLFSLKLIA